MLIDGKYKTLSTTKEYLWNQQSSTTNKEFMIIYNVCDAKIYLYINITYNEG